MSVDSEVSFRARAKAVNVPEAYVDSLCGKGVNTFSAFAFVSSYQPNAPDETPFVKAIQDLVQEDPKKHMPALRRLFWESHTLAVQDLRDRFEARTSEQPRKLSMADRIDRLRKLKTTLPGLTIDSILEPSHALVDRFVAQAEEQCFQPVALSACTSRETEMRSERKDPVALSIEGGLKITKSAPALTADTGSEMHIRSCMTRRALAMHMAGIATFSIVDRWITRLFGHLLKPALNNLKPPNLQQLVEADRTLWMHVAQNTRGAVLTSGAPLPVDAAVEKAQDSPEVAFCLLPRPGGHKSKGVRASDSSHSGAKKTKKTKKKKGKGKQNQVEGGKRKAEDQGEEPKKPRVDIPQGAHMKGPDGKPNCFAYSRGNCKAQDKEKCVRGLHRCWFCHGQRPGHACPKAKHAE